jgi:adenylyltransferase/sulfurtransferase
MPSVGVPRLLRYHLDEQAATNVTGATLGGVLANLFEAHPLLARHVTDESGALRSHVVLALNGSIIGAGTDLDLPVEPDDQIEILQAVSGG